MDHVSPARIRRFPAPWPSRSCCHFRGRGRSYASELFRARGHDMLDTFGAQYCSYEPELFPGLIYRMLNPKVRHVTSDERWRPWSRDSMAAPHHPSIRAWPVPVEAAMHTWSCEPACAQPACAGHVLPSILTKVAWVHARHVTSCTRVRWCGGAGGAAHLLVYWYMCACVCRFVCMYACILAGGAAHLLVYWCTDIYMCVRACVCTGVLVYVCVCVCVCVCMYVHRRWCCSSSCRARSCSLAPRRSRCADTY
jgi:hypothetical protein